MMSLSVDGLPAFVLFLLWRCLVSAVHCLEVPASSVAGVLAELSSAELGAVVVLSLPSASGVSFFFDVSAEPDFVFVGALMFSLGILCERFGLEVFWDVSEVPSSAVPVVF